MKNKTLPATLLTTAILVAGFTFSAFAEEVYVRDENGKFIEYVEIPDQLDGKQFSRYIENSTIAVYSQESEIQYKYDEYLYDIYTLAPVEGGWYKYGETSNLWDEDYSLWMYAIPGSGYLIKNSWILDNGNVYLTNSEGITRHGETIVFEDIAYTSDFIYNVQTMQWEPLPFTQVGNTHVLALPYNMNITYDDFVRTLSGEKYEQWKAEQAQTQQTEQQTQSESNLEWSMFDIYISQAMEEKGYYSYEVVEKVRIETNFNGVGVYKVKVRQGTVGNSYHTGYLNIYLAPNGGYWKSTY